MTEEERQQKEEERREKNRLKYKFYMQKKRARREAEQAAQSSAESTTSTLTQGQGSNPGTPHHISNLTPGFIQPLSVQVSSYTSSTLTQGQGSNPGTPHHISNLTPGFIQPLSVQVSNYVVKIICTSVLFKFNYCKNSQLRLIRHQVNSALWLIRTMAYDELDRRHWLPMLKLLLSGVCTDTNVIYQSVLKK